MQNILDLWINPEIERRKEAGNLEDGFVLRAAQVILNVDASTPEVRLNEEVVAVAQARAARPIEAGEKLTSNDLSTIESIELTEQDPNAAHITIVLLDTDWYISFDFRYNATRILEAINAAEEFLSCAVFALKKGYLRAFVENLYGATELMAKGILIRLPEKKFLTSEQHKFIASSFNLLRSNMSIDGKYVNLLNRLSRLRSPARYGVESTFNLDPMEAKDMLLVGKDMLSSLRGSALKRRSLER